MAFFSSPTTTPPLETVAEDTFYGKVIALTGAVEQLCFGCDTAVGSALTTNVYSLGKKSLLLFNSYSTAKEEWNK